MALAAMVLAGAPGFASADTSPADVDPQARAIYQDFMSPYCPGLLLADCRSPAAVDLRAEVRRELEAGASEADVRARLESQFGEKLLAAPHARGFGLLAWLTPYALLLGALVAVFSWMRSHRGSLPAPPGRSPLDAARLARLEEERRASL